MTGARLVMPAVWSEAHRLHDPHGEVWVGVRYRRSRCRSAGR